MKRLIILIDGAADRSVAQLGGLTPLQYARTPHIDRLTREGVTGLLQTIPDGFNPGSEVANMAILGYHLPAVYEGRAVLEAASRKVELQPGQLALRCNLICIDELRRIKDHSAGHIATDESTELIRFLNEQLGGDGIAFHSGSSYRHLLTMHGGNKQLYCTPPHDMLRQPFEPAMIRAATPAAKPTADRLNELIRRSQELLPYHPINHRRTAEGKDAANSVWFWSPGYRPVMPTLRERYTIGAGAVITAADLIRGIGVYAGLDIIEVEGATGLYDTNYAGKAAAALAALDTHDFVFLHIEAIDEAGHDGNVPLKVRTIEDVDRCIVGPILDAIDRRDEPIIIALLPDHPTPCELRTHTADPVPFVIRRPDRTPDRVDVFDEFSVQHGTFRFSDPADFMQELMR